MNQLQEDDLRRLTEVIRHAVESDENGDSAFALRISDGGGGGVSRAGARPQLFGLGFVARRAASRGSREGRVAVQLEPASERVSLLLFRVLWSAGERDMAFEEMKRFLAVGHSEEYSRMLEGWKETSSEVQ